MLASLTRESGLPLSYLRKSSIQTAKSLLGSTVLHLAILHS